MKCGSQVWFPESQRDVATVIGALFNPLGVAAGQAAALMVSCAGASATAAGAGSGSGASSWELVVGIADADGSVASAPPPTAGSSSEAPQPQQQCAAASDVRGMPELLLTQAAFASASMIGAHSMSATGCSACRLCLSLSLSLSVSLSLSLSLSLCVCVSQQRTDCPPRCRLWRAVAFVFFRAQPPTPPSLSAAAVAASQSEASGSRPFDSWVIAPAQAKNAPLN
jgi:hypothetical protein